MSGRNHAAQRRSGTPRKRRSALAHAGLAWSPAAHRRCRVEVLEDRHLLAVGDLLHTILPANPLPQADAQQGYSVAASADYRVTGVPLAHLDRFQNAGAVKVYGAATNGLVATLNNPAPAESDHFGFAVAVAGNYVVVGALNDDTGAPDAGLSYVYDLTSATPTTPIATLNNPTPATGEQFGCSVAVAGNYVVVGVYRAGSACVYDLASATPTTPIATLNNPTPGYGSDYFGASVAVADHYVLVGAYADDTENLDQGAAYVFDLNQAPVADAGGPYLLQAGEELALDGTRSQDDGVIASYLWDLDNDGLFDDASGLLPTVPWSTLAGLGVGPLGNFSIDLRVEDSLGGVGYAWTTLEIIDTIPPMIAAPPDRTLPTEAGQAWALLPDLVPECLAWDWGSGIASVTMSPPAGSQLPWGAMYAVLFDAQDMALNMSAAMMWINVVDPELPVIFASDQAFPATDPQGAMVHFQEATATDNVGVAALRACESFNITRKLFRPLGV